MNRLSKEAMANKKAYNQAYAKKYFKSKILSFNTLYPEDIALLEWVKEQRNGTQYIKDLIKEDMARKMRKAV